MNVNIDDISKKFLDKKQKLTEYIKSKDKVTLVTMGPKGTTSSMSAEYFKNFAIENLGAKNIEVLLYDTFEIAVVELKKQNADLILLPNAYGKMTNFYWDITLELVFTFIVQTPEYGLAAININEVRKKDTISVSTCKAVEHLLKEMLVKAGMENKNVHIVEAYSTKKSLTLLEEGKVDIALTNDTSLVGSNAYFITDTMHTEVLWSIFMNKR